MGAQIQMLAAAAQTAAQKAAKAEKTRQKALNLMYTDIYAYMIGGILGALVLRNLLLGCVRHLDSQRRNRSDVLEKQPGRLRGDERHAQRTAILRWSERLDHLATRPVRGFPIEWTYLRFFLVTVIVVINTVFCIVRLAGALPTTWCRASPLTSKSPPRAQVGSTHLHSEQSAASSIARAFSRRCGRMAVANYPILFCFAGRNSVIARLTGEFLPLR